MKGKYYTVPQVAKIEGYSRQHLLVLAKTGRVPGAMCLGRTWFIPSKYTILPPPIRSSKNPKGEVGLELDM